MRQCAMSDATAWFSATRLVAFAENDAVHLRAAVCEVGCNRVVRRRGLMRPLHDRASGASRGRGHMHLTQRLDFSPAPSAKSPASALFGILAY